MFKTKVTNSSEWPEISVFQQIKAFPSQEKKEKKKNPNQTKHNKKTLPKNPHQNNRKKEHCATLFHHCHNYMERTCWKKRDLSREQKYNTVDQINRN